MSKTHQLKYLVLSDLHLGEKESLFTPHTGEEYSLLAAFSDCLADLLTNFNEEDELPKFILNGDILGLAFSTYQEALQAFEHFIAALTVRNKLCDQVAYLPGNHDHHIWQQAIEDDYRSRLANRQKKEAIPELLTATAPLYKDGIKSSFLNAFMQGLEGGPTELKVLYPNFILPAPTSTAPFVIFHHGHFAENTYHFVSQAMRALYPELPPPATLSELELQNGAWIDFAFSQLGRSGEAGQYFERLMMTLSSKKLLKEQVQELAENLAKNIDYPYLPFQWMEEFLSKRLILNISEKVRGERYKGGTSCSDETMQNLLHYFNKFCQQTLTKNGWQGQPVHFVWSHTHKPFEKVTTTEAFGQTKITNTGGWVLPESTSPQHGGSILLINQDNEVQSLRIFMDYENQEKGVFKVQPVAGEQLSDFGQAIHREIYQQNDQLKTVWTDFKKQLEQEIQQRRNNNQ